ncbi:TonB-dependent receptor [Sphingobium yanoikuyae]|uniref:TonB-dependent receptor n=1 Tax=Sphingobium yanoikuyae TaxID=13690 RepID=UPI0007EEBDC6|nr:TonB-dependent receptor [Sphingobium yanoikuyae]
MGNKLYLGTMTLGWLVASPCAAQGTDPSSDIVVTGRKIEADANRVSLSAQTITGADLTQNNIITAQDLVRVVPGLTYTLSSYGTPVFTIRGVGFYDTSLAAPPAVSMSIDEAPIPYPILAQGMMMDLERVDVLKGPQGTLFGQNSTGGAVNFVAAKPTEDLSLGGRVAVARFGSVNGEAFLSGPLTSTLKARLAVKAEQGGAWQRSDSRDDELGDRAFLAGRLLVDWSATETLSFELNLNGWRDRSDTLAGQFVGLTIAPARLPVVLRSYPLSSGGQRAAEWDQGKSYRRDSDFWHAALRSELVLPGMTFTSISSYQHFKRNDLTDADGTALTVFDIRPIGSLEVVSQELRASGATRRLSWIVGGNYQHESVSDDALISFPVSSLPFAGVYAKTRQRVEAWALFANLKFEVVSSVTLEGGLRYTNEVRRFRACAHDDGGGTGAAYVSRVATLLSGRPVSVAPGGCATLNERFEPTEISDALRDRNWSWRAAVNWEFAASKFVYASVSRGHKSGAFPTLGATATSQFTPAQPESLLAVEAGFKLSLLNGGLQINGAGFYYDYDNKQLRGKKIDPRLGPLSGLVNVPKSRIYGAELSAQASLSPGLSAGLDVSYTHSRIDGPFMNYDGIGNLGEFGGEPFPLTPQWQLAGSVSYERPISDRMIGYTTSHISYQDKTNSALGELPLLTLPDYILVDAALGVKFGSGWDASIFVRNLLDENYATLVSTISPDVAIRLNGQPRTYGAALSFRF